MTKAFILFFRLFSMTAALQHWGATKTNDERTGPLSDWIKQAMKKQVENKPAEGNTKLSCDDEVGMLDIMSPQHQLQHLVHILQICKHPHYRNILANKARQNPFLSQFIMSRRKRRSRMQS